MKRNAPENKKNEQICIDLKIAVTVLATFVLLFCCLIVMFIGLAIDNSDSGSGYVAGGDGGGGKNNNPSVNVSASPTISNKTGIVLPCVAKNGNVSFVSSNNMQNIDNISSEHAILVNLSNNTSVAEKKADIQIHPASMTKVMTLIVACESEKANATALLTITKEMFEKCHELDGSGLLTDTIGTVRTSDNESESLKSSDVVGKSITFEDALHLIAYQSDTVACLLVAEYIGGSEEAFVSLMNKKAQELGLDKTNFVNSTGLTEKGNEHNVTTCRQMASIMAYALNNETVKAILTTHGIYDGDTYKVNIYDYDSDGNAFPIDNYIPFYPYWYNYKNRLNKDPKAGKVTILGAKTGYEDIPTSCWVSYGVNESTKTEYICVTVGKGIDSSESGVNNATATADLRAIYKKYATE